jgi:hypothetical protein
LSNPGYASGANVKEAIISQLRRDDSGNMSTQQEKFATILQDEGKRLLVLDRYERRALSRRKSAIRALDMARLRPTIAG